MEQEPRMTHPTNDELALFWSETSTPEVRERLSAHVDECAACASWIEALEPSLAPYSRCLEIVHARTRRAPLSEADLVEKMKALDARRTPRRLVMRRPVWVSGIAAAFAAVALFLVPFPGGSELRADTLLDRAAAVPAPTNSHRILRVRSGTTSFERPATWVPGVRESAGGAALKARFAEAHYDWVDPLSVRSFRNWRQGLSRKKSVISGTTEQKVDVTTDEGTLREAALTLDAKLLPVSVWFRFADQEWVEITAGPEAAVPEPEHTEPVVAATTHESIPVEPLVERELDVRLAIDAVHPGASEPIEVSAGPDGAIQVTTYRLAPEMEARLRAGLERIQGVGVRSATGGEPTRAVAPRDAAALDRAIHVSQDVSFEAHLLAELANRFTPARESELSPQSRTRLWELRMRHAAELKRGLALLRRELEQHRGFHARSGSTGASEIQSAADLTTAVERSIAALSAASDSDSEPAAVWRQLAQDFGTLEGLATGYGRYLEQQRKELP